MDTHEIEKDRISSKRRPTETESENVTETVRKKIASAIEEHQQIFESYLENLTVLTEIPTTDPLLRMALWRTFRGKCFYSGHPLPSDFHVDHIVPEANGGPNCMANYVPCMPHLNELKNSKFSQKAAERTLVFNEEFSGRVLKRYKIYAIRKNRKETPAWFQADAEYFENRDFLKADYESLKSNCQNADPVLEDLLRKVKCVNGEEIIVKTYLNRISRNVAGMRNAAPMELLNWWKSQAGAPFMNERYFSDLATIRTDYALAKMTFWEDPSLKVSVRSKKFRCSSGEILSVRGYLLRIRENVPSVRWGKPTECLIWWESIQE